MGKPTKQKWKLKDLRDSPEAVSIHEWSLETPPKQYTASAAHYEHQAGVAFLHFAQMVGASPMNALAVSLPRESVVDFLLPSLGPIRERLARLKREGKLKPVTTLKLDKVAELRGSNSYTQLSADRVRVATGDSYSSLDFFKLPILPPALIEARPHDDLEVEGVVRVVTTTSLFAALVKQMEEVEGYEPEEATNAGSAN